VRGRCAAGGPPPRDPLTTEAARPSLFPLGPAVAFLLCSPLPGKAMKQPVQRRLAAILAADLAGYSRLMGADEEGTHERLKAHLRELVDPKIKEHRGRTVKNQGEARRPRPLGQPSRPEPCRTSTDGPATRSPLNDAILIDDPGASFGDRHADRLRLFPPRSPQPSSPALRRNRTAPGSHRRHRCRRARNSCQRLRVHHRDARVSGKSL
jgi:hypothetical protein